MIENDSLDTSILNNDITIEEVNIAVKGLRRNKAIGLDFIENDHLMDAITILAPLFTQYFNLVFSTGFLPETWLTGTINPIYKGKGSRLDPNSYRPITILSCFGKLFTRILNNRLSKFIDAYGILHPNQAGFRKGFCTSDNIFVMQCLMQILKQTKRKLFTVFIDFTKAFDSVWRVGLWYKLLKNGIQGRFLSLVKNMYHNIRSKVAFNNELSDYFPCNTGVRQGENLSPLLFSLYINDLEPYLLSNGCNGINLLFENDTEFSILLHFLVLLYADDTVIFTDNPDNLQKSLDLFFDYCSTWKLKVNMSKTKIVIFGSGPAKNSKHSFTFGADQIEIVDTYTYLGIKMHRNRRFIQAVKSLTESATKAMFSLLKKARNVNLPLDCLLSAFDTMIAPILLYGVEVWGYENLDIIEKVHTKFLKLSTGLRQSTPNFMLYGELGREPLSINAHKRIIAFWHKLACDTTNLKLTHILYKYICISNKDISAFPWLKAVKDILDKCGLSYIFTNPGVCTTSWLVSTVESIYKDQFLQNWKAKMQR